MSVQHSSTRIAPSRTVRPRAAVPTGTDGSTELRAPLVSNLTSRLWPVQVSNASTVLPSNAAAGPRTQPCEGVSAVTLLRRQADVRSSSLTECVELEHSAVARHCYWIIEIHTIHQSDELDSERDAAGREVAVVAIKKFDYMLTIGGGTRATPTRSR